MKARRPMTARARADLERRRQIECESDADNFLGRTLLELEDERASCLYRVRVIDETIERVRGICAGTYRPPRK